MDLTFQVLMQYCSLQHQTLLQSPVTSRAGYSFCFGSIPYQTATAQERLRGATLRPRSGGRPRGDTQRPRSGVAAGRSYPTPLTPKPEARVGRAEGATPRPNARGQGRRLGGATYVRGQGRWTGGPTPSPRSSGCAGAGERRGAFPC